MENFRRQHKEIARQTIRPSHLSQFSRGSQFKHVPGRGKASLFTKSISKDRIQLAYPQQFEATGRARAPATREVLRPQNASEKSSADRILLRGLRTADCCQSINRDVEQNRINPRVSGLFEVSDAPPRLANPFFTVLLFYFNK